MPSAGAPTLKEPVRLPAPSPSRRSQAALFRPFRLEARALVDRYWHVVITVAARLIERETLTGDKVGSIIAEAEAAQCVADAKASRAVWAQTVARASYLMRHSYSDQQRPSLQHGAVNSLREKRGQWRAVTVIEAEEAGRSSCRVAVRGVTSARPGEGRAR